jgi:hypothetical protein
MDAKITPDEPSIEKFGMRRAAAGGIARGIFGHVLLLSDVLLSCLDTRAGAGVIEACQL